MAISIKYWDKDNDEVESTGTTSAYVEIDVNKDNRDKYLDLYVDYTKGDESRLNIYIYYKGAHGSQYYKRSYLDSDVATTTPIKVESSDTLYIPIPVSDIVDYVKVYAVLDGGTTGSASLEIERNQ